MVPSQKRFNTNFSHNEIDRLAKVEEAEKFSEYPQNANFDLHNVVLARFNIL